MHDYFRSREAGAEFKPPRSVVNAVEEGKLDSHVLLFWKLVVDKLTSGPNPTKPARLYAASIAYWRNKCAKNGYALPKEYLEGLGGEGSAGRWAVAPGDDIEDWVKQRMISDGLLEDLSKSVGELEVEVLQLQSLLEEAKKKLWKHSEALQKIKTDKGALQRIKWIGAAEAEVDKFTKELKTADAELSRVRAAAQAKMKAQVYAIEFEREFQFMMQVAKKDVGRAQVLDSVRKALARFEQGLEIPDAPGYDRTAGLLEGISSALLKTWNYLKGAFELLTDWVSHLGKSADKLEKFMKDAT